VFAVAALTLASIGSRLDVDAKGLREGFDNGAERLADAAVAAGERSG
jgi:hypothetical protein